MKLAPVRGSSCKHSLILIRWVVIYSVDSAIQRWTTRARTVSFGPKGVLWISSDKDDQMGKKIKPQNIPRASNKTQNKTLD